MDLLNSTSIYIYKNTYTRLFFLKNIFPCESAVERSENFIGNSFLFRFFFF